MHPHIKLSRLLAAAVLCTIIAMTVHIKLLAITTLFVSRHMEGVVVAKQPYGFAITSIAYMTFIFQAVGMVLAYYMMGDRLPAKTKIGRGILFGLFLLFINGQLIRQPLMNIIVGNPVYVAVVQQCQIWASYMSAALVIALVMPLILSKKSD